MKIATDPKSKVEVKERTRSKVTSADNFHPNELIIVPSITLVEDS